MKMKASRPICFMRAIGPVTRTPRKKARIHIQAATREPAPGESWQAVCGALINWNAADRTADPEAWETSMCERCVRLAPEDA